MQNPNLQKTEEIEDMLISLGVSRMVANTLAYMHDKEEIFRTDVERGARLCQPEVSIVMKELEERGWINVWEYKKLGKGRPPKAYSLKIPFKDIITQLEEQQNKAASEAQARIERLRELWLRNKSST